MKTKRTVADIFKGCKQAKYIPILKDKINFSKFLYKSNKNSDEYMSTELTYQNFLVKSKLIGKKIFEPFHGDGSFKKAFKKNGVIPVSKKNSNFWDIIFDKKYSKLPIVSNPPFSFKYQVMHTLLQLKRNFALVLPERTVINNILPKFKEAYGGKYKIFTLKGKENTYMCKNTNKYKRINTVIVDWKF
jgi:hypothetical protein